MWVSRLARTRSERGGPAIASRPAELDLDRARRTPLRAALCPARADRVGIHVDGAHRAGAPSLSAAMARMPVPVPMSSTRRRRACGRERIARAGRGSPRCCRDGRCRRRGPARSRRGPGPSRGRRRVVPRRQHERGARRPREAGRTCCQALAHASSSSGRDLGRAPATGEAERGRAPPGSRRRAAQEPGGRRASPGRRRAGRGRSPGRSSSTTPRAPCSQRKLVRPSDVSGVDRDGELPERHQLPKSFFIRSTNLEWSGPVVPRRRRRNSSSSSRWRAVRRVGTSSDHLVAPRRRGRARAGAACPCPRSAEPLARLRARRAP